MTIYAAPRSSVEASLLTAMPGGSGLVGTIRISIIDTPNGVTFLAPATTSIFENPAGSGLYHWSGTAPSAHSTYSIIWDRGESNLVIAVEELVISGSAPAVIPAGGPPGTYNQRFGIMNRFLSERCAIMRYLQIGSDEGTPIQGLSILHSSVPCRVDTVGAQRNDSIFRSTINVVGTQRSICYLPPEIELLPVDQIAITSGAHVGYLFQTISGNKVLGAVGAHHNEVECQRVIGAT